MDDQIVCPHCKKSFSASLVVMEKLKDQTRQEITKEYEYKIKNQQNAAKEIQEKNKELQEQMLEMATQIRKLAEARDSAELDAQKKLTAEATKIKEEGAKEERQKAQEQILQLKKMLEDTQKAVEDAKRKASQPSQQLQGEVMELNLEEQLREHFPHDSIEPVKKGVEGGDILQHIHAPSGLRVGTILWEVKKTKNWSKSWLAKLREDMRNVGASTPVLVSDVLPEEIETFGQSERVWVTAHTYAIPLAYVLRGALIKIAEAKTGQEHKKEKMELLHQYLTSETFIQRFESQVEGIVGLKNNLDMERRSLKRIWRQREVEIERLMNGLGNMYGEFKAIMGSALPVVDTFELPSGSEDQQEE